jgi:hypothetical protein
MKNLPLVHALQILSASSWEQPLVYSYISNIVSTTYFRDILCCTLSLKLVYKKERGTIGLAYSASTLDESNKVSVFKGLSCWVLSRK